MIKLKFQSPIVLESSNVKFGWKRRMKKAAKNGKALLAVKEIKIGLDLSVIDAKILWDTKYKKKYYKHPKS